MMPTAPVPSTAPVRTKGANTCRDCHKVFTKPGELCWHCQRRERDLASLKSDIASFKSQAAIEEQARTDLGRKIVILKQRMETLEAVKTSLLGQIVNLQTSCANRSWFAASALIVAVVGWTLYLAHR